MGDIRAVLRLVCRGGAPPQFDHSWPRVFLCVILSDERSEESKEPFGCQAITDLFLVSGGYLVIRAVIGVLRCAQDDTLTFMNDPAEGPLYPRYSNSGIALEGAT